MRGYRKAGARFVPIHVERFIQRHFKLQPAAPAQMHQDFVFDAAEAYVASLIFFGRIKRVHGLDQPDRADGDEILDIYAVFSTARNVYHKAQIALDERSASRIHPLRRAPGCTRFLLPGKRRGSASPAFT